MIINNIRISFPNIFRTKAFNPGDAGKYSVGIIIEKNSPEIERVKAELQAVRDAKWPGKKPQGLKICLTDGKEKEGTNGYGDSVMYFNASNTSRPLVLDKDKSPLVEDDGRPYAGCYCNASIDFWAQDNQFGKRINASLKGLQFVSDGEPFGGGAAASADDFDVVEDDDFANKGSQEKTGTDDFLK